MSNDKRISNFTHRVSQHGGSYLEVSALTTPVVDRVKLTAFDQRSRSVDKLTVYTQPNGGQYLFQRARHHVQGVHAGAERAGDLVADVKKGRHAAFVIGPSMLVGLEGARSEIENVSGGNQRVSFLLDSAHTVLSFPEAFFGATSCNTGPQKLGAPKSTPKPVNAPALLEKVADRVVRRLSRASTAPSR